MKFLKPSLAVLATVATVTMTFAGHLQKKASINAAAECYSGVYVPSYDSYFYFDEIPPMNGAYVGLVGYPNGGILSDPLQTCDGGNRFCCAYIEVNGPEPIIIAALNKW